MVAEKIEPLFAMPCIEQDGRIFWRLQPVGNDGRQFLATNIVEFRLSFVNADEVKSFAVIDDERSVARCLEFRNAVDTKCSARR